MDHFLDILQTVFSASGWIWGVLLFFQTRKLKKAQLVKDTRAVWQEIAESNNESLLKQNERLIELHEEFWKLKDTLEMVLHKIVVCRHYDRCPVQKGIRHARDNPVEPGQDGDTDRQPP